MSKNKVKEKESFITDYLKGDKKKSSMLFWHLERLASKYTRQCIVDNDDWYDANNRLEDQTRISDYLEKQINKHLHIINEIINPLGLSINMESSYTSIVQLADNGVVKKGVYYV